MKNSIAKMFKETRVAYGETQEEFAPRVPCSRVSLSNYETGTTQPSADKYDAVLKLRENLKTGQRAQADDIGHASAR